jgi:hypothetical protein
MSCTFPRLQWPAKINKFKWRGEREMSQSAA